ncbi:MAG: DUF4145 domain-containing protein [Burkholderiaceae bacterium]|jgi:hypothetical protein|nr:DUF4145 domain-containing protein [Burkholderiaceae bacterium]
MPDAPRHLPDDVEVLFLEGARGAKQTPHSACIAFRSSLEAALKKLDTEISGRVSLKDRIDRLAAKHLLPPAIQDWAHHIRDMGNDAAHADGLGTKEEVKALAQELEGFTRYVLLYLFTLPREIELARQRRAG